MLISTPRVVVTAPGSSSGKTLATMGIIYGLRKMGYRVQPFKIGPDFIDPSYLEAVSGLHAINLDLWVMGRSGLLNAFSDGCKNSDICVIEGVMGYLDGAYTGRDRFFGSTYRISGMIHSGTIVVIDASKTAQTALATALGIAGFSGGKIGIVLNRVAGEGHAEYVRRAIKGYSNIVYVGHIYEDSSLMLEERKLGLVPTAERHIDHASIGKKVSENLDINAVLGLMGKTPVKVNGSHQPGKSVTARISVAFDDAFNFYYWDSLASLRVMGAKIEFFSPVNDIPPSDVTEGIIMGGGFPELFAGELEKSGRTIRFLKNASSNGTPILAECGGLMYLTEGIYDKEKFRRWAGVFGARVKLTDRLTIGYTELEARMDNPISSTGQKLRGHEYHYSNLVEISKDQGVAMKVLRGVGVDGQNDGLLSYNSIGTYSHFHLGSSATAARRFLELCASSGRR
ncbi:MAG: cobyrinate a,c-diamide synthase [Nitrososphaerota archaeon]|nr:cobyrinate a,c-diamide synthase [Nitrososphaerota archaeon]MDG6931044.1 cobyrinate a,c-diamide synthase [Nitrososphaerota archaeon]